jgi:hypothetical protein
MILLCTKILEKYIFTEKYLVVTFKTEKLHDCIHGMHSHPLLWCIVDDWLFIAIMFLNRVDCPECDACYCEECSYDNTNQGKFTTSMSYYFSIALSGFY